MSVKTSEVVICDGCGDEDPFCSATFPGSARVPRFDLCVNCVMPAFTQYVKTMTPAGAKHFLESAQACVAKAREEDYDDVQA